jgi:hypothetical protein
MTAGNRMTIFHFIWLTSMNDENFPNDNGSSLPDLRDVILENAKGPKKVTGDAGSVEQHSIKDQIEAERFLQSKKATRQGLGIRFVKLRPDGTV